MKKENLSWILRLIISALFLLSAVAKLYPSPYFAISTFEVKQLYPLGFSEGFAPYFSRILIGIEFALGIAILLKDYLHFTMGFSFGKKREMGVNFTNLL